MDHRHYQVPDDFSGGLYVQSPNLSQFNDGQSTSTSSSESFQTQVPLPYYLSNREEQHRSNTGSQDMRPWATPDLGDSPLMESFHSSRMTLNPATDPYVPHSHLSQSSSGDYNFRQAHFEHPSVYLRGNSSSPSSAMMNHYQQGTQIGQIDNTSSYQNHHSFAPPLAMNGGIADNALPSHFQQPRYGNISYDQYASPVEQFPAYFHGYHMSNAGSAAAFAQIIPTLDAGPGFHSIPHSEGLPPSSIGQPWATNFPDPNLANTQSVASVPHSSYNQDSIFGAGLTATYNIENQPTSRFSTRQSSLMSVHSKQSTLTDEQTPRYKGQDTAKKYENSSASIHSKQSTLMAARTPLYSGQDTIKKFERRSSIRTPLEKTVQLAQTPTPERTVKKLNPYSKLQNSRRVEIEDSKSNINVNPTPGFRPHAPSAEFSSEPRKIESLSMRSRRGQTVSSADPPHKSAVFDWLQNTPGIEGFNSRTPSEGLHRPSPPKMGLLAAGSMTASNLKTIDEDDPFVYGPKSQEKNRSMDPFASMRAVVPYNNNSLALAGQNSGMSAQLRNLTSNGTRKPTFAEAADPKNLPFAETCRLSKDDNWGVVKIKNIPYSVNRPEVLAFLGRNAKIVAEYENEPVHIIMERVTSKTLDCYVEFVSFDEAVAAVNRFETNRTGGRSGRLGQRHVEVELSSQEHLMKDLFPKAKNVKWNGSKPIILSTNGNERFNSGFQGFVSREELVMLVKHVESPQRSPFSKDCPQRPFECLISTLLKYPWHMVHYITIEERNLLHKATIDLLALLVDRINTDKDDICLTPMLLKRVWKAALKCRGFTPSMKDDIVFICQIDGHTAAEHGVAPFAPYWKYLWTIGPKPGVPADLLLWYIAIIRETTEKRQLSLAERAAMSHSSDEEKLFGELDKYLNFPEPFQQMTLAEVAQIEWTTIEVLLRQALG